MKPLLSTIFSLLFIYIYCLGQTRRQRLIAAEYRIDSPRVGNYTYLVSYNFNNGLLLSKDTILGAETSRTGIPGSYVRYDLGKNFIYHNRYVISGTGNVIDITKKALVIEESDDFVKSSGDTLIFHRNNIFSGTGFLMLNLQTGQYNFINSKEWDKERERRTSPDQRHFLSIDYTKIPYRIWLHDSGGRKRIVVNDAGHGPNIMYSSQFPAIETHWLDDHSFLYAVHETRFDHGGKDYSRVTLRRFDISTSLDKVFFVLDSVGNGQTNGRFLIDNIGQLIYRTSGWGYYIIDTARHDLISYDFYEWGFGFSIANKSDKDGTNIKYNHSEIGKLWFSNAVVGQGAFAAGFGEAGSNLAYPKGIKAWSDLTKTWTTINIPWLSSIIGWVDE